MNQVLLSDVCEINPRTDSGISDDTECSFVPMEYVDDISGTIANTSIRRVGDVKKGYTFFKNGDVIFAKITPCMENGKCAIGKNLKNGIAFGSTEYHVVRAKEEIIPEWIYHFLRQGKIRQQATHWFRGTAGQQRVPATFLEELKIPLPPLTEQKWIASLLRRADRLRQLRRTAHDLGDALHQSVFLEMFGEYLQPNCPTTPMEELVKITGGGTPSRDVPEYFQGNIPWLTSKDMRGDYIYDTQEHITEKAILESATNLVPIGSILLVVKSKILMHRLPIAITKVPLCHGQDIKSIQCSNKVNPRFLVAVLKYNEAKILFQARGANTEGLTLPMLNEIKVPNVPLSLQEEFAGVVARVEGLRGRMSEAGRQVEGLFESLLNESFGG